MSQDKNSVNERDAKLFYMKFVRVKIFLIFMLPLIFYSCKENLVSNEPFEARFVVDTLNITANPDSAYAKLVYHFDVCPGYLTVFLVEVYYTGYYETYGINQKNPHLDSVGKKYRLYKSFHLYYKPATGYKTYAKCKINGMLVKSMNNGETTSEPFTWSDSTDIIISE